jgi:hypothetical protein
MNTFQLMRLIVDAPKKLLNSTDSAILMVMALIGNREGKNISPGIEKISSYTKLSDKTIRRSLNYLVRIKALIISKKRKIGSSENLCYEFNINFFQDVVHKKVPVTMTGTLPVTVTGTIDAGNKKYRSLCPQVPVTMTGRVPVTMTGTPYTPILEPLLEPTNVELGANSTPMFPIEKKSKIKKSWKAEIEEIFGHWVKEMNHPRSKLDEARKNKIMKALKLGYTVEELKKAIDGIKKSSFHMGDNKDGTIYDSISLIFRNPEKIEEFICKFDSETAPKNKNGATALKPTFLDNNRNQLKAMDEIEKKFFPQFSKCKLPNNKPEEPKK